jgi:hypothetical protein
MQKLWHLLNNVVKKLPLNLLKSCKVDSQHMIWWMHSGSSAHTIGYNQNSKWSLYSPEIIKVALC